MAGQGSSFRTTLSELPGLRPLLFAVLAVVIMGVVMIGISSYQRLTAPYPTYFSATDYVAILQLMIFFLLIVAFIYGSYLALNTLVLWRRKLRADPALEVILQRYASGELTKEQLDMMIRDVDVARNRAGAS